MAIDIRFDQFINDPRVWQAFIAENQSFFGNTPIGKDLIGQFESIKKRWGEIEKHIQQYPNSTYNWQAEKERLKARWQGLRTQVRSDPTNPANPNSPLNPANTPPPAAAVAAPPTAPPVYLPNFDPANRPFPTAEAVRDMTYDPGIGGFLRPPGWQPPAATPRPPGAPATQPGSPFPWLPQTTGPSPFGQPSTAGGAPFTGFGPSQPGPGQIQYPAGPGAISTRPAAPMSDQRSQFPWQPGY